LKINVAQSAGFCFGVKNAVRSAEDASRDFGRVCSLGELIHNSGVVEGLRRLGVSVANDVKDIDADTVITRAHGASPKVFDALRQKGVRVIDATCPFVKRIHVRAEKAAKEKQNIIVIGSKDHPEIVATMGWAGEKALLVDSVEEAQRIPQMDSACVIGQTTYSVKKRDEILSVLKNKISTMDVFDFICPTTAQRQHEAEEMAKNASLMIIVGDKKSANTNKLFEAAKRYCERTYLVSGAKEAQDIDVYETDDVCITAGASTPPSDIAEVVMLIKDNVDISIP